MADLRSVSPISIDLVEQVENQKCVVFAGPGVSIPPASRLGPPGPALLAAELALALGYPLDDYSLPWIAQVYAARNGIDALRNYVATRLVDERFQPSPAQQLLALLPLPLIIYTGYDGLLLKSFQRQSMPVALILRGDRLMYRKSRTVIQPYGFAAQPATLLLTEDEQMQVFDDRSELARFLRVQAETNSVVFLGYARSDRGLRDLYRGLRPEIKEYTPEAYLVVDTDGQEDLTYWQQRSAVVLEMKSSAFLQQLAEKLTQRGKTVLPVPVSGEDLPSMDAEERSSRQNTILKLSNLLGLGSPVESGQQLAPIANGLALLRQAIEENKTMYAAGNGESLEAIRRDEESSAAQILLQQGNAEWGQGNYQRAREFFEEGIQRDPELVDAYFSLFYLLVEMGELDQAMDVYSQVLRQAPEQALLPERFEIQRILGQTGIGICFAVHDTSAGRPARLTLLNPSLSRHPESLERFGVEIRSIASSRINRLYEIGRYRGRGFLLAENIEGPTLRERLDKEGHLALPEALQALDQVAEALEDGQRQGVCHLGLQPDNIVLSAEGARLVDYGFHRFSMLQPFGHEVGRLRQTEYGSPEQRAGDAGDERSDVYALGTILYETLAGFHPGMGTYQPVSEMNPQADEAIDLMIAHARSFDPAQRFRSITEMRREFLRISATQKSVGQYLRRALSCISSFYAHMTRGRGLVVVSLLLVALSLASGFAGQTVAGIARLILILLVTSIVTATVGYYIVRETARQQGLGSLIPVGRGIGALLGLLFSLYVLRITDLQTSDPFSSDFVDFLNYLLTLLMTVVVLTGAAIFSMRLVAGITNRRFHRYTRGFYGTLVVVSIVVLLLAVLGFPPGLLSY